MKFEVKKMKIDEFMRREKQASVIVIDLHDHWKTKKKYYYAAGTSLLVIGIPDVVSASTGIDAGARKIYDKLLLVGKWIIIIKGGIDIISAITNGDVDLAKKRFLGYLIAYGALQALPWGMDQVDLLFKEEA
jgi:hypothetical protein